MMETGEEGIRLIKSFESYMKKLPDGRCTAYQGKYRDKYGRTHLDIPTIGWGCTENVEMGDIWTKEEAENGLRRELIKHEKAVNQLVTVEINQNQFDALVSFSYNIGTGIGSKKGGLKNSSVLANLNKGNYDKAADCFNKYNVAYGGVQKGLVSRRKRESALFLKPEVQPDEPYMPQGKVGKAPVLTPELGATAATTAAGIGTAVVAGPTAQQNGAFIPPSTISQPSVSSPHDIVTTLPSLPKPPDLEGVNAWRGWGGQVYDMGGWMVANPGKAIIVILGVFAFGWALPMFILKRSK